MSVIYPTRSIFPGSANHAPTAQRRLKHRAVRKQINTDRNPTFTPSFPRSREANEPDHTWATPGSAG